MTELTIGDTQELARLRAIVKRVERAREAMREIAERSVDHIQHVAWVNAENLLADAINGTGGFGACEPEPTSRFWAVWSTHAPERLLKLVEYDRPRTEAEALADLPEPVVPLTGRLEAIDRARLMELRKDSEKEKHR